MAALRHLPTFAGMDASIKTRASLLALSLLSFSACDAGGDEGPVDGRDDAFLGSGKADGAISEDSDEARAVLALVNTASFEVLDDSDEVGLDVRAARGIYARRIGDDELPDTADDVPFETLAELDAVPWVGPSAFGKLLAYALDHGYGEVSCDEGIVVGDRCFLVEDEEISEVPTSEWIYNYEVKGMGLHADSNGFTVTGSQDLNESGSWVSRGMWAEETPDGWSYATSSSGSHFVDTMIAPDGSLERIQVSSYSGHSRRWLSAGSLGCSSRYIGSISRAFGAYAPSGQPMAVAAISGSARICVDGEFEQVATFGVSPNVGLRFTETGEPQVITVVGRRLSVHERNIATGWEEVASHLMEEGTHLDRIDVVEAPDGNTHVYVGTLTFTNDLAIGDLTVERVVLDDDGVLESLVLFEGRGADVAHARAAHLVQAGIDAQGREFVAIERMGSSSTDRIIDLITYDGAVERTTIDTFTTPFGHVLRAGFAVAPDGTLGLTLQALGLPLRMRRLIPG